MGELVRHGIKLNEAGKALFDHAGFTTSDSISTVSTIELTVANLGFPRGGVFADILGTAVAMGFAACPLELGPHLRLQFLDQQEGQIGEQLSRHKAPFGSITVFSLRIDEEEGTPQGFYLRRVNGELWLRGYWSGAEHIWDPDDHLVFVAPSGKDS